MTARFIPHLYPFSMLFYAFQLLYVSSLATAGNSNRYTKETFYIQCRSTIMACKKTAPSPLRWG